jgi:diguanylate cyclase (GGDEF)-like protein
MGTTDPVDRGQDGRLRRLAHKVHLIEDLWSRIQHVRWSEESFGLLRRMVADLDQVIAKSSLDRLREVTAHLNSMLSNCDVRGRLLSGAERVRIGALVEGLSQATPEASRERPQASRPRAVQLQTAPIVALISANAEFGHHLLSELHEAGYRARRHQTWDEACLSLQETPPDALVVELSAMGIRQATIGGVAKALSRLERPPALLFISERSDLAARLAAVQAGSSGFFVRPFEVDLLLDRLRTALHTEGKLGERVMIVDDDPDMADRISTLLQSIGLETRVVSKTIQLLQALSRFEPDLLVLDVHLGDISGVDLARVVRQHEAFCELPILFVSVDGTRDRQLDLLVAGGDDFLPKPFDDQVLVATVANRLRRTRELNRRLKVLSGQDTVAHLANRRRFLADLEQMLPGVGITVPALSAMLVSVDNFAGLREKAGLAGTDRIMVQAGRRLRRVLRPGDVLARYGDSGFALMTTGQDEHEVKEVGESIGRILEERDFEVGGRAFMVTTSIGACLIDEAMGDAAGLMELTEVAVAQAREQAVRIHIHNPRRDRDAQLARDREIADLIRDAVDEKRATLLYQPIVALGDSSVERYEVLLRLREPGGQELLPETIFAVAERHHLAADLDRFVFDRALQLLEQQRNAGKRCELFVNVSHGSLVDDDLHAWLSERVRVRPADAPSLLFELSEDLVVQDLRVAQRFVALVRKIGCRVSLERFGLSSESAGLLERLEVDCVKLHNRLLAGLGKEPERLGEIQDLTSMVHGHGAEIIAAGVEDPATLACLWRTGVNYAQGYFLQEPYREMAYDFASGSL